MVRSMMSLTTLPLSFWDYALETAAHILNMVLTKKVDKTPYELWHGKVLNLFDLKAWGCEAHVKRHTADKLEQRSIKCIFVGYPKETMGYYFYYPPKNKVVVERYADLLEREFILQKESGRTVELDDEDTIPSENTSEHPIEAESLAPIIKEDVVPVRRSTRTPKAPNRLCLIVEIFPNQLYFNVEVEEHSLGDKGEPANLPSGAKVVKRKWIYKKKTDMDGVKYRMDGSKRGAIPMQVDCHLDKSQCKESKDDKARMQNVPYASAVGSIMYTVRCTRPDDLRPIEMIQNLKLEAEYIAAAVAAKEAVRIRKFVDELGVVPSNNYLIEMNCDNTAAISINLES
uniref:Retroviral polymerase SH3-like domain-containing protein n=1 Tax=Tanacetum cinerariifolium TaxID=118510 RepID=A0A699KR04_TANCI|nr:hypothetical protein [Tanacetum cinerariifolium]